MVPKSKSNLLAALLAIVLFIVGAVHTLLTMRVAAIVVLTLFAAGIFIVPIKWSLRFFFFYLGFEGIAKVLSNYHPIVHIGVDLLVLALTTKTLVLLALDRMTVQDRLPPATVLIFLHIVWFLISIFNPYSISIVASLAGAKVYVTMTLLFFFAYYLNRNDYKEMKIVMGIWIVITTIHVIIAYYQTAIGPTSVTSLHPRYSQILMKYSGRAFRPFGLTHIPGMPAVFIFLALPFLLYFTVSFKQWVRKGGFIALIPIWSVMLFLCQIRSSLLKAAIGGLIFVVGYHWVSFKRTAGKSFKRLIATTMVVFALIFSLSLILTKIEGQLPDAMRAIQRSMTAFDLETVTTAREGALDRWLAYVKMAPLGAGLSRTGAASGKFQDKIRSKDDPFGPIFFADNFWIATTVDLGVPGMLLITLLIGFIFYRGILYLQKIGDEDGSFLHLAIFSGLFASAIGMYGSEAMLYNPEAAYFWYFSGCLIRIQVDSHRKNNETLSVKTNE